MSFKENLNEKRPLQETLPRDFKGIWIPREIWLHTELSWFEKMLWAEIDSLDCAESGCTASNKYFESFFGLTGRSVQMSLARLKRLGLIAQTHFDGRQRTLRSSLKSTYEKFCTSEVKDESRGEKNFTSRAKKTSLPPTPPYKEENKEENSVCSSSPPASQAPPVSGDSEPEKPSFEIPKKEVGLVPPLIISDFRGNQTKISIEDLFTHAVLKRMNWTSEEIRECWNILADYRGVIRDVYHFVDGTIKKMRTIRKSEGWARKKEKEKKCKKTNNGEYTSTCPKECGNSPTNSSMKYADRDIIKQMFDSLK